MKKILQFIKNKKISLPFKKKVAVNIHKNFYELIYLRKEKVYKKFSKNIFGIKKIGDEKKGLTWYCSIINKDHRKVIKSFKKIKNYSELEIFEINGKIKKSWRPLEKNFEYINRVAKHYFLNFKKKKYIKINGDLTLDNIIFSKKSLFIIDWEHFGSKKKLWGYDIAYLFLSSLCLPYIVHKKISKKDEELFLKLWKKLLKFKVNKKILYDPFYYFERSIKSDPILKRSYLLSKSKFFPFITNKAYKERVKKLIKRNI